MDYREPHTIDIIEIPSLRAAKAATSHCVSDWRAKQTLLLSVTHATALF
jgi:hypothetical protein